MDGLRIFTVQHINYNMTWKELKEAIEQMSIEEQEATAMVWPEYDCPRPISHLSKIKANIYTVDGMDIYCDEKYAKDHPEEPIELVLEKGDYCLKL